MGTFCPIEREDFDAFVTLHGFTEVNLPGTFEYVYGKRLDCNGHAVTLRIYSGIDKRDGQSREVGSDAIRVCLVGRNSDGKVFGIAKDRRVNRTQGWRKNLANRLASISCNDVRTCPRCGSLAAHSKRTGNHYCSDLCWKNKREA